VLTAFQNVAEGLDALVQDAEALRAAADSEPRGKAVLQSVPTRALPAGAYRCRSHVK
jgi:hypothetical protein